MMIRSAFLLVTVLMVTQSEFRDEAQYREEMREIDHAFAVLSEHRPIQKGLELEREAARLAELFEAVEDFWKERGEEEAANFAAWRKTVPSGRERRPATEMSHRSTPHSISSRPRARGVTKIRSTNTDCAHRNNASKSPQPILIGSGVKQSTNVASPTKPMILRLCGSGAPSCTVGGCGRRMPRR